MENPALVKHTDKDFDGARGRQTKTSVVFTNNSLSVTDILVLRDVIASIAIPRMSTKLIDYFRLVLYHFCQQSSKLPPSGQILTPTEMHY